MKTFKRNLQTLPFILAIVITATVVQGQAVAAEPPIASKHSFTMLGPYQAFKAIQLDRADGIHARAAVGATPRPRRAALTASERYLTVKARQLEN